TLRPLDSGNLVEEMRAIARVFNLGWAENPGASELSEAGIRFLIQEFRPILDPSLAFLALRDREVVGFSLALPDVNPLLRFISHFPSWLQLPAALGHRLMRPPRDLRLLALGLLPGARGNGLTAALVTSTVEAAARRGYRRAELSWILEENLDARRYAEALGATVSRRYRLYSRDLRPVAGKLPSEP
ncbi:MAG: GNAT family N-acetyltransferase, partial [Acidobacteria bacterium]|nr:GNAT family N-acetyltransferase [Acidobacteriota bacterium]